ncbi:MAG: sulfotransferase domain-containing protein [Patescibacteria group bacterium]
MEDEINKNVYIASLPRSGSTLLGMILHQNPQCFNMGESFFWKNFPIQEIKCSCGEKNCPILSSVYQEICQIPEVINFYDVCQDLDKLPFTRNKVVLSYQQKEDIINSCKGLDILADVFRSIISRRIMIDTSTNIRIAKELVHKNNWKIIILLRDPRGVLYSFKKSSIRHNKMISLNKNINVLIDFIKNVLDIIDFPNVLIVKYEDICQKTKEELKKICSFLDIEFAENMLNFKKDMGHTIMGNRMRFNSNEKIIEDLSWVSGLTQKEKGKIKRNKDLLFFYGMFNYTITN